MKRVIIAGLCLVGSVVASGPLTASASASAPEFGRCLKAEKVNGKYTGKYGNSKCLPAKTEAEKKADEKGEGKYEWSPGVAKKQKVKSVGGIGVLTTVGGAGVECKSETASGEFSPGGNDKEEAGIVVRFKGCKSLEATCTSPGAESGELVTNELEGLVGWENKALKKTDLELSPAKSVTSGLFIEFSCIGLVVKVRGHVLVPFKNDTMKTSETLKFVAKKGKQKPEKWEESSSPAILEASFKGGPFEQAGQNITATVEAEEPLELNATV